MPRRANVAALVLGALVLCLLVYSLPGRGGAADARGRGVGVSDDGVVERRTPDADDDAPAAKAVPQHAVEAGAPAAPEARSRIGVLLIACNRVEVRRAIDALLKYRPSHGFPIVVSQDCGDQTTAGAIDPYEDRLIHLQQPNLGTIENVPRDHDRFINYYKISRHYKWALTEMFDVLMFDEIIIVEDDLEIAPDFFAYFEAMLPVLRADPTLYCVSAWNDNGKAQLIDDPAAVRRTDFFPGLGWMLTREIWAELKPKWPAAFWDDWLRHANQRQDRSCIQPEISRTYTFGERGASVGQYWKEHLQFIVLNTVPVDFRADESLATLHHDAYDAAFLRTVYEQAEEVEPGRVLREREPDAPRGLYRLTYRDRKEFETLARVFQLMSDIRSGVPRCAYKGVVEFKSRGHRVFLAPPRNWGGYSTLDS